MSEPTTFAEALRAARRLTADPQRGGHLTLERLAELISQHLGTDNQPTPQTVCNWERSTSRPNQKDRDILLVLVAVLVSCGGLTARADADQLLTLGGYASLTTDEHVAVFGEPPSLDTVTPGQGFAPHTTVDIRNAIAIRAHGTGMPYSSG